MLWFLRYKLRHSKQRLFLRFQSLLPTNTAFTLSKKIQWVWVWLDSTGSWEGEETVDGSAKVWKGWKGGESTDGPEQERTEVPIVHVHRQGHRPWSTVISRAPPNPRDRERGKGMFQHCVLCEAPSLRPTGSTLTPSPHPYMLQETWGGGGWGQAVLSRFRNCSFYLPAGWEHVVTVTRPQGMPSLAHFLRTSFSRLRSTCKAHKSRLHAQEFQIQ